MVQKTGASKTAERGHFKPKIANASDGVTRKDVSSWFSQVRDC
jgi:hypothetical protein